MEVLSSVYKATIKELKCVDFNSLCLWILHADKIPPHIGISNNGLYFSLKVSGKDERVSVNALISTINKKKIPTLCYELVDLKPELKSIFSKYNVAIAEEITCLAPIKDALECQSVSKVSELIEQLEINDKIKMVGGINLPEGFEGIPSYDIEEIHARLKALKDVK